MAERTPDRGGPAPGFEVTVRAGGEALNYCVLVGRGLLSELPALVHRHAPAHRYAVISDETVGELYGKDVAGTIADQLGPAELFTFPAGEAHKTRESWATLSDALLGAGFGRDSTIVAVGGGVTGDLGGFVAATYLRGVPVVQVPTSVVAMIDASVGGKTGVDSPHGKNLVGAFHPPRLVVADPDTLGTLPRAARADGLAEAIKHGAILDQGYLDRILELGGPLLDGDPDAFEEVVVRSVELKSDVVTRDEREGGLRQILNFGHTLGHALEAAAEYAISHGAAVSMGMVLEGRIGESLGVTEAGTTEVLRGALAGLGLPTDPSELREPSRVLDFLQSDKKTRRGTVRFVLLSRLGAVARTDSGEWSREVPAGVVEELLRAAPSDAGDSEDRMSQTVL